ncbi:MAG: hypothetical protein AAGI91_13800 [Bacteroidota bacterium]
MDAALLRRVRTHILDCPERFCAAHWAWVRNGRAVREDGAAPEGFRGCIAAHVLLLSGTFDETGLVRRNLHFDNGTLSAAARDVLGLDGAQYRELFYPSQWPDPFRARYYTTQTPEAEAAVCAAYLADFLGRHAPAFPLAADRPAEALQHTVRTPVLARS